MAFALVLVRVPSPQPSERSAQVKKTGPRLAACLVLVCILVLVWDADIFASRSSAGLIEIRCEWTTAICTPPGSSWRDYTAQLCRGRSRSPALRRRAQPGRRPLLVVSPGRAAAEGGCSAPTMRVASQRRGRALERRQGAPFCVDRATPPRGHGPVRLGELGWGRVSHSPPLATRGGDTQQPLPARLRRVWRHLRHGARRGRLRDRPQVHRVGRCAAALGAVLKAGRQ